MADSRQSSPPQTTLDHTVNCAILDRILLHPSADVQSASMQGETVLLDVSTGRYYTLNRVGSVIWEHCTGHNTIGDIHAVLCRRFEVAPERVLEDLVALINQLVQEGLLQPERR